jgi:hypothetical protein
MTTFINFPAFVENLNSAALMSAADITASMNSMGKRAKFSGPYPSDMGYQFTDPRKWMINCPKSTFGVTSPDISSIGLSSLGSLETFPVETLQDIYRSLDLQSLAKLRLVSSKSKAVVESLIEYQKIKGYIPDILHTMVTTKCASYFSAVGLCSALCADWCVICEVQYGLYIFLPTAQRCCNHCLYMSAHFEIILLATAMKYISEEEIRQNMCVFTTLPGFYMGDDTFSESTQIVRWEVAMELCLEINGNTEKTRLMYEEHSRFSQAELSFDHIPRLMGVDHPRDPTPGMVAMSFAHFNLKTGMIESGTWCRGCEHDFLNFVLPRGGWPNPYRFRNKRERAFSEAEFLLHFEGCLSVKRLLELKREEARRI